MTRKEYSFRSEENCRIKYEINILNNDIKDIEDKINWKINDVKNIKNKIETNKKILEILNKL